MSCVMAFAYLVEMKFKGNKGCASKVKILVTYLPLAYLIFMIYFVLKRNMFQTKVCLCSYQKPYLNLEKIWHDIGFTVDTQEANYIC
mmetsp:Transcript_6640/g.10676  ORF Transcript_6640/g.10676 Transcript_6640/m.10676 type:complete len:87 (+) Transcript_6640:1395-1655(+)